MTSNFVNKIFMISRLITKFTTTLCHENLELYGIANLTTVYVVIAPKIDYEIWFYYSKHPIHCILNYTALHELCISRMACDKAAGVAIQVQDSSLPVLSH